MQEFLAQLVKVLKPIIMQAASSRQVKELVVQLLEKYVKTTDNDVDDVILISVKKALLKWSNIKDKYKNNFDGELDTPHFL